MKYLIFLLSFLFLMASFSQIGIAQDFENYQELKSQGELPIDYIMTLVDKFDLDKNKIGEDEKRRSRKQKEQFYLESNFSISELVKSGNVIFNDTISNYLNHIYTNIQNANPSLKGESIRFYTCKSTIINAYATHAGIIFFNIGLVAKIETEDELAYIMCHEIAHCIRKHNIKQYTYNEKLDSNKGELKEVSWEDKMFSKANYSQIHEMEADSLGLVLFANSDYSIQSSMLALGNLKTYNMPFASDFEFSKSIFSSGILGIDTLVLLNKEDISVEEYEIDSLYITHPEIDSRVESLFLQVQRDYNVESKEKEPRNNQVQKIAQFELPHLYLESGMSYHALYCILALMSEFDDNKYLEEELCKSLYAISQNSSYCDLSKNDQEQYKYIWKDYKEEMKYDASDIQQVAMFLDEMNSCQLNELSTYNLFLYLQKYPNDKAMLTRLEDLIIHNVVYFEAETSLDSLLLESTGFDEFYSEVKTNRKDEISEVKDIAKKGRQNYFDLNRSTYDDYKLVQDSGIEKLIFVNPEYREFDLRKDETYKYQASEKTMIQYVDNIKATTSLLDIEYQIISSVYKESLNVDMINEISTVNTFITENDMNSPWTISSQKETIKEMVKKYGTDKIAFVGTYSFQLERKIGSKIASLAFSIVFFPILPLGVLNALSPQYRTFTYVIIYDLNSENIVHYDITPLFMNGTYGVINTTLYNSLHSLKND